MSGGEGGGGGSPGPYASDPRPGVEKLKNGQC